MKKNTVIKIVAKLFSLAFSLMVLFFIICLLQALGVIKWKMLECNTGTSCNTEQITEQPQ